MDDIERDGTRGSSELGWAWRAGGWLPTLGGRAMGGKGRGCGVEDGGCEAQGA